MAQGELDLEAEYNNRARVPDHGLHIAAWEADSAAYRAIARCELDLPYGDGSRHRVDLFHPAEEKGGPVVFFIHGGYWQALDKSLASHLARGANERGLTVAVPNYDLAPDATLAEIVRGIAAAADFVAARLRRPLVASGHSAGGHLAACLIGRRTQRPIKVGMPISGLFDLTPLVSTSVNKALGLTNDEARRLSPLFGPAPSDGRLDVFVGGTESSEYHRQSETITERWREAGLSTSLTVIPGAHHFDVIDGLTDPSSKLVETLVALAAEA